SFCPSLLSHGRFAPAPVLYGGDHARLYLRILIHRIRSFGIRKWFDVRTRPGLKCGLRPENVTVVDADSNTPLLRPRGENGGSSAYDLDEELSKTLVRTLDPVVGATHVRASVHVEYDLSTSDNT